MAPKVKKSRFASEAALCEAFIAEIPKDWTAYRETAGWDILLVHKTGVQIGVEAKLSLNARVLEQALPNLSDWSRQVGPDFRAVLVPAGCASGLETICAHLGLTVIALRDERPTWLVRFDRLWPRLPDGEYADGNWYDRCPVERCKVPEYVPDTQAGTPAPLKLTDWKIKAIKIAVTLDRRGYVTAADFKHLRISMPRWTQYWLAKGEIRGQWVRCAATPDLKAQHPTNYEQIAADYDRWRLPDAQNPIQAPVLFEEKA